MPRVTIRLTTDEANALVQLPGENTSARVRYLLHQSTLLAAIRAEIERGHMSLASKIAEAGPQGTTDGGVGADEFRQVMAVVAQMFIYLTPDANHKQLFKNIAQKIRDRSLPK